MIHNSSHIDELTELGNQMRSEAGDASRHQNQDAQDRQANKTGKNHRRPTLGRNEAVQTGTLGPAGAAIGISVFAARDGTAFLRLQHYG
jgi:hypothetical protein